MPPALVHVNATEPRVASVEPTTTPASLTSCAKLFGPPSVPIAVAPLASQTAAWVAPLATRALPAISPALLMRYASDTRLSDGYGSSCPAPLLCQRTACELPSASFT